MTAADIDIRYLFLLKTMNSVLIVRNVIMYRIIKQTLQFKVFFFSQ